MLCLNEGTPIVMALCLLGSVLFIVGGSLWGSGNASRETTRETTGIVLFSISMFLSVLGALGCWCNSFFCTPNRKSQIALKLYGTRPPLPTGDDEDEEGSEGSGSNRECDKDWEEYAGSKASYRSFRSGRNSSRNLRSRTSLRRDRVMPTDSGSQPPAANGSQLLEQPKRPPQPLTTAPPPQPTTAAPPPQPPPPPLPPRMQQHHHQQQQQQQQSSHQQYQNNGINHSSSTIPVPIEYSNPPVPSGNTYAGYGINQRVHVHDGLYASNQQTYKQHDAGQNQQLHQQQLRFQQEPLTVRPHVTLAPHSSGSSGNSTSNSKLFSGGSANISDSVVV